jgi:hypothetical protein
MLSHLESMQVKSYIFIKSSHRPYILCMGDFRPTEDSIRHAQVPGKEVKYIYYSSHPGSASRLIYKVVRT